MRIRLPRGDGRFLWALAALLAGLLFALDQGSGGMPYYRDRLYYFLPQYEACRKSLEAGAVPLWNPFMNCGQPLLATWQVALGSPLSLPFLIWPFDQAVRVFWMGALSLAAAGMYLFGLRAGLKPSGAAIAAIAYAGAGPMRSLGEWPNIVASLALLPLLLLAFTDLIRGRRGAVPFLAIALGLQFLSGQPRQILIAGFAMLGWLAAQGCCRKAAGLSWGKAALALLLGLGIASLQLLPSAELFLFSDRRAHGVSIASLREGFMALGDIFTVFSAKLWGTEGHPVRPGRMLQPCLYLGLLGCWLAARGLARAPASLRLFLGFTLVPALLVGFAEPLASLLLGILGAQGAFRYLGHWVLAGLPAVCLMAGAGADTFSRKGRTRGLLAPAAVFGLILLLTGPLRQILLSAGGADAALLPDGHLDAVRQGLLISAGLFSAGWLLAGRGFRTVSLALPALLFLDLLTGLRGYEAKIPAGSFPEPGMLRHALRDGRIFSPVWLGPVHHAKPAGSETSMPDNFRARWELLAPNIPQVFGVRNAAGYEPFSLKLPRALFSEYGRGFFAVSRGLRLAGVRWLVAPEPYPMDAAKRTRTLIPGWALHELPDPLPLYLVLPGEAAASGWERIPDLPPLGGARPVGEGWNHTHLIAQAAAPGLLFLSTPWLPGWRATVNGVRLPPLKAGGGFLSVRVPTGVSRADFDYSPPSFSLGLFLATLSLAAALSAALLRATSPGPFASSPRRRRQYRAIRRDS